MAFAKQGGNAKPQEKTPYTAGSNGGKSIGKENQVPPHSTKIMPGNNGVKPH